MHILISDVSFFNFRSRSRQNQDGCPTPSCKWNFWTIYHSILYHASF